MMDRAMARVDLHLHSLASNVSDYYAANVFSLPESWSEPLVLYGLLRQRGMSLVTLTDHNSIDGCRALLDAGLPDVFISAEMTTTFPEDGCNIHVTVVNMTEAQFAEVARLRRNIYDMIGYLEAEVAAECRDPSGNRLAWFMTHPLMSTQNRPYGRDGSLRVEHIEKALLLCPCVEVQNGTRTPALNELTRQLVTGLDQPTLERLAEQHRLAPVGNKPWHKALVGGSDDHAGINPGRTWTEFQVVGFQPTANSLVDAIRARQTSPAGQHGGPITLAHAILKLVHDGSRRAAPTDQRRPRLSGSVDSLLRLVFDRPGDRLGEKLRFQARAWARQLTAAFYGKAGNRSFEAILEGEIYALVGDRAFRSTLAAISSTDDRIFCVVKTLVNRIFAHYIERVRRAQGADLVSVIKETVALFASNLFVSLPYLVSYVAQSTDCLIARDIRRAFEIDAPPRVALVTDTYFEINGVSATIQRMIREAIRRGIAFTVITCLPDGEADPRCADPEVQSFIAAGRLKILPSIASLDFPEYDGLQVHFPPLLDLLRYLQESGCTKLQISTPGTIGIAGLLAAKLLQIETAATYHTCIPEYVENYTRDMSLEAITWKYMIVFYHAVDEVLVPSRYIARLLHKRGLRNRKLLILDRWVDVERFHPSRREADYWDRRGIPGSAALTKFVYVGRVAVEKDLHLLAAAYRKLRASRPDAHLIIIGDGPYRKELERQLVGVPVTFTGFLEGAELPRALASADVKLFPSTTDTWGNAPLEAQACGLPVVVSDIGGPAELMLDGITGYRVVGRDVAGLHAAMLKLMDPVRRRRMGASARHFAEVNRVDEPFTAVLDSDAYRRRLDLHKAVAGQPRAGLKAAPLMNRVFDLAAVTEESLERDLG